MSKIKVIADNAHNDIVGRPVIEIYTVIASTINEMVNQIEKVDKGFINNTCDINKIIYLTPIIHFAKFQKFYNKQEIINVKRMIDLLKD